MSDKPFEIRASVSLKNGYFYFDKYSEEFQLMQLSIFQGDKYQFLLTNEQSDEVSQRVRSSRIPKMYDSGMSTEDVLEYIKEQWGIEPMQEA